MNFKKIFIVLSVILTSTFMVAALNNNKPVAKDVEEIKPSESYVTLKTSGAEYEIVTNEKNMVTSVNGLNDLGKMAIINESYEDQDVVNVCKSLAYTSKGLSSDTDSSLTVEVISSIKDVAANLRDSIIATIKSNIEISAVTSKVAELKSEAKVKLAKEILEVYPELTLEDLNKLEDKDLFELIALSVRTKSLMPSINLENKLIEFKNHEFKFLYHEAINQEIANINGISTAIYNCVYEEYKGLYNALKQLEEELTTKENSPIAANLKKIEEINTKIDSISTEINDYKDAYTIIKANEIVTYYNEHDNTLPENVTEEQYTQAKALIDSNAGMLEVVLQESNKIVNKYTEIDILEMNANLKMLETQKQMYLDLNDTLKENIEMAFDKIFVPLDSIDEKLKGLEKHFTNFVPADSLTKVEDIINKNKDEILDRYINIFDKLIKAEQSRITEKKNEILATTK